VLLAERHRQGEWGGAWRATRALVLGFGLGVAVELGAALLMVLGWAVAAFALRT
jgi:hypothetical protein